MTKMKYVLTAAALCLGMLSAQAQSEKVQPTAKAPHNCLTSTTDKDWTNLGLSAEQSAKVKELQADWRTSERAKADKAADAKTSPMMDSYESKVKEVLTPEQYDKWVKWCTTHAQKGEMENSIKKD